jgi:hypothetical protein
MVGELITLPVRVGVRATRLWLHAAEETVAVAVSASGRLLDAVTSRDARIAPDARAREASGPDVPIATAKDAAFPAERTTTAADVQAEPQLESRETGAPREWREPAHVSGEPAHVSEEAVLVDELAEPGAEDGAGPEVHIDEPWDGYESMNAKEVIARLAGSSPAELAAVALYERGHRSRHTVLAAVERELRVSGGAAGNEKERTDA